MDRRVDLFYSRNGSVEVVSQESPPPVFAYFITLCCFLLGVSHNMILLSAVLSNKKLRNSVLHQMLTLVSLACLLDCLTNESVAVGLLLNNVISWCSLSAVLFPLFLLLHSAALAMLCLERTVTLYKVPLTMGACLLSQLSICLCAILFSLPLLAASEVHFFGDRNSCGTVQHHYVAPAAFLLGVLLCWACQAVYLVVAIRSIRSQQHQTTFSPIPESSPSVQQVPAATRTSDDVTGLCFRVMSLYVTLLAPQTVSVVVTQFLQLDPDPDPWLDPRLSADRQTRSVSTTDLDLLLTYLRYMYNVAVPVAVLSSDTVARRQARSLFCCSRNIVSSDSLELASRPVNSISYKTPVLFSTPQGIHLRMALHETPAADSVRLITQFCDLTDPPDYTEDWIRPGEHRNVRFSSRVQAISLTRITSGSEHVQNYADVELHPDHVSSYTDVERHPGHVQSYTDVGTVLHPDHIQRDSDTRTVLNPVVLVREEGVTSRETDRTYSKF